MRALVRGVIGLIDVLLFFAVVKRFGWLVGIGALVALLIATMVFYWAKDRWGQRGAFR